MDPLKYFHVHWVDGMKINKDHFIAMENALNGQLLDIASLHINDLNYGLLPPLPGSSSSLKMVLNTDNQDQLRVKIQECRAITQGGARIEILENCTDIQGFSVPFPETERKIEGSKNGDFYVVLSVQPFKRIPIGEANPAEDPPRYPFTVPEVQVHILPDEQVIRKEFGSYFISLGKVRISDGQAAIVNDYIPPCTSIQSHPLLKDLHSKYDNFLSGLEVNLLKILRKVHERDQENELTKVVTFLSTSVLSFISNSMLDFRWNSANQAPFSMFEYVARCARVIKNAIDANSGKAREELLNYFMDWSSLNQGEFETMLVNTVNFHYDHTGIQDTAVVIDQFVDVISTLFDKLSDLEYIGKKKDTGIFVKEQKGKSSFLAD